MIQGQFLNKKGAGAKGRVSIGRALGYKGTKEVRKSKLLPVKRT